MPFKNLLPLILIFVILPIVSAQDAEGEASRYYEQAMAKKVARDSGGALADLNKALEANPKHKDARFQRGTIKYERRDIDGAITDLSHVIEVDHKHAQAYFLRASAKTFKDDGAGALADLNKAIIINPREPKYYMLRAGVYRIMGKNALARTDEDKYFEVEGVKKNITLAPAGWQKYTIPDTNISFQMPKLPVFHHSKTDCLGLNTKEYAAYAAGAVYTLRVTYKVQQSAICVGMPSMYDDTEYLELASSTASADAAVVEEISMPSGLKGKYVRGKDTSSYFLIDPVFRRWYQLEISNAAGKPGEEKKFAESLTVGDTVNGTSPEPGSPDIVGDIAVDPDSSNDAYVKPSGETVGRKIVMQIRPPYTEEAKLKQIAGIVELRVAFMSNGSIGSIVPVKRLGAGLTEQAIMAARKIAFIPSRKNGIAFSTATTVTYSFTLY